MISLALMAYAGYHARLAHQDSEPYMIKAAEHARWLRTNLTTTPFGRKVLFKISTTTLGSHMMQLEARYLGLPGSAAMRPAAALDASDVTMKPKPKSKKSSGQATEEEEQEQEQLVGQPSLEGFDDDDEDEDAEEDRQEEEEDHDTLDFGEPEPPPAFPKPKDKARETMKTEVVIKGAGGMTKRRDVDLRKVRDMSSLQKLVAKLCQEMRVDLGTSGLRMQYVDAVGKTSTVSRSTAISSICSARTLMLMPKDGGGSGHSSRQGDMEQGRPNYGDME